LTRKPVLQSPIDSWFDLVKLAKSLRDVKTIAPWQTLAGAIAAKVGDERLRQVASRYATYSGSNPWLAPAALLATPYIEETFGVWHISGGVFKLAKALQDRCEELGVVFHFDQPVSAITTVNSSATGVKLADGSNHNADFVVSNIDAGVTYHLMPNEPTARSESARIKHLTPSFSGFTMSLALRGRTPGLAHHNVFFPRDYQKEFQQLFAPAGQPVKEPAIYVCSPNDPSMRPGDDFESWFVLVNAPLHAPNSAGGVDWRQPGLAKSYAADLEEATGAPGGAIYGAANHGAKATFLRPKNQSPIKNLYLVGGSAHPGGGVPLVLFSAAITANLIAPGAFVTQ
jgi:phytoene dehydrogenase-like protein